MRLRSDFWVAAFLRRCDIEGVAAVLRRRGAAEAGAVYVKLDVLDGRVALFGPAPQSELTGDGRLFIRLHKEPWIEPLAAEALVKREIQFDTDIWIVELESRAGLVPIDLVEI